MPPDLVDFIGKAIDRHKREWPFDSVAFMDWEDVKMETWTHCLSKIDKYEESKGELEPWLHTVIRHKIFAIRQKHYTRLRDKNQECLQIPHELKTDKGEEADFDDLYTKELLEIQDLLFTASEKVAFHVLYIDRLGEEEIASRLGLKTTEEGRKAGYGQIANLKRKIYAKIKSFFDGRAEEEY